VLNSPEKQGKPCSSAYWDLHGPDDCNNDDDDDDEDDDDTTDNDDDDDDASNATQARHAQGQGPAVGKQSDDDGREASEVCEREDSE
jgi:hypothetical protein